MTELFERLNQTIDDLREMSDELEQLPGSDNIVAAISDLIDEAERFIE